MTALICSLVLHIFESLSDSLLNTSNELNAVAINECIIDLFTILVMNTNDFSYLTAFIFNEIMLAKFNEEIDILEKYYTKSQQDINEEVIEINSSLIKNKVFIAKFLYKRLDQFFEISNELNGDKFIQKLCLGNLSALFLKILYLKLHNYDSFVEIENLELVKKNLFLFKNNVDFFLMLHLICSENLIVIFSCYKSEESFYQIAELEKKVNYFYSNLEIMTSKPKTSWQLFQIKKCFYNAKFLFANIGEYNEDFNQEKCLSNVDDRYVRNFTLKLINTTLDNEFEINLNDFIRSFKMLNELLGIFEDLIALKYDEFQLKLIYCLFEIYRLCLYCDELVSFKLLIKKILHLDYEHDLIIFFSLIKKSFRNLHSIFKQQNECKIDINMVIGENYLLNSLKNSITNDSQPSSNIQLEFFVFFYKQLLENFERLRDSIILCSSKVSETTLMENYFLNDYKCRYNLMSKELVGQILVEYKEKKFVLCHHKNFADIFENLFIFLNKPSNFAFRNKPS